MYDFLLVRHCKYSSILYRFWVIRRWIISWPWNPDSLRQLSFLLQPTVRWIVPQTVATNDNFDQVQPALSQLAAAVAAIPSPTCVHRFLSVFPSLKSLCSSISLRAIHHHQHKQKHQQAHRQTDRQTYLVNVILYKHINNHVSSSVLKRVLKHERIAHNDLFVLLSPSDESTSSICVVACVRPDRSR